ncbi:hypothetical protein C8R46DRAFT_1043885 [Mycena filopes]|nr:hypothetical protein C8R46DRAFT_1043885 [Mycena filopes]
MRFIGVEQKVVDHGFCVKVVAALKFIQICLASAPPLTVSKVTPILSTWNVGIQGRTKFDEILPKNVGENDARVVEGVSVGSINFSGTTSSPSPPSGPRPPRSWTRVYLGTLSTASRTTSRTFAGDWSFSDPSDETMIMEQTATTTQEAARISATAACHAN